MHKSPTGDIEDEADRFASEFLMPSDEIAPQLDGLTIEKAARLKPYWRVSMAAIVRKAKDLRGITDRQYRTLYMKLGTLGYRTNEPIMLPGEEPTIVPQLLDVYRTNFGYSDDQIAQMLFSRRSHFFKVLDGVPLDLKDTAPPFLRYRNQE
jgi:Zn-dependent peptidase ImmA (M78 family)